MSDAASTPPAPPSPPAAPAPVPSSPEPAPAVSDAAAALARRRHELAADDSGEAVRMVDLHDLERDLDGRLAALERARTSAPAPAPAVAPGPAAAPARRGGFGPLLFLVAAAVVVLLVAGTRKVTP